MVMLPHPSNPHVLLTAGWDGRVVLVDLFAGSVKGDFVNVACESLGPITSEVAPGDAVRVLDGAVSPDGTSFAFGDTLGRLLVFSASKDQTRWDAAPAQQFFEASHSFLFFILFSVSFFYVA
jgi:hypothetical protein